MLRGRGAEGLVDLYMLPAYDDIAMLFFFDDRWHLHYAGGTSNAVEDKPLTKKAFRDVRGCNNTGWLTNATSGSGTSKRWSGSMSAMRFTVDRSLRHVRQDPSILPRDLKLRQIEHAAVLLEGTYIIRLFAGFETALRVFFRKERRRPPPSRTRDLLETRWRPFSGFRPNC